MSNKALQQFPANEDEDSPLYKTDGFRMFCFKVLPCSKRFVHDWTTCPFAHPAEKAKRRDPRVHSYTGVACPEMKKGQACSRGDVCSFAHNVFEYWLHPSRYRTQMCNDGVKCTRKICFFAHTPDELRQSSVKVMPPGEAAKAAAAAAAAVGMPANGSFPEAFERQASSSGDTLAIHSDSALARFQHDSWEYETGRLGPMVVLPGSAGSSYKAGGGGRIRHVRGSVDTARAHRLQPLHMHDGPHSLQHRYSIDFGQLPHMQGPPTAPPGYLPPDVMGPGMLQAPSSGSDAASSQATAALAAALLHMQLAGNSTSGEDEPNSAPSNVQEALVQQHQAQVQQLLLQHALMQQQHEQQQQQQADAQNTQFFHLLNHQAMAPGVAASAGGGYGSDASRVSPPLSQFNLRAPHQMSQLSRDFMPTQAGMPVPHSEGELHGGGCIASMGSVEGPSSGPSSRQLGGALGKIDESGAFNGMHMHLHDL